ncbi:MAG: hypothetical protein HY718_04745 [Planctomycetes bacterium]|nr:hypothetical protein [Planctomycetota bacterium]
MKRQAGKVSVRVPHGLRWRGTVVWLAASLLLTVLCLPLLDTVIEQVRLMVPSLDPAPGEAAAIQAAHRAWQADRRTRDAMTQFHVLTRRDPTDDELGSWLEASPDNALPILADLLVRLRRSGIGPSSQPASASQPAIDDQVAGLLQQLENGPPLRPMVARLRTVFVAALRDRALSARRAEVLFDAVRWSSPLVDYRPIVREAADRLMALGGEYRRQSRPADARRAYAGGIRVLTDAVEDSPLPDVALLVAARLPAAIHELQAAGGAKPDQAEAAIRHLQQFRQEWMEPGIDDVALLPAIAEPAVAAEFQREAVGALVAAVGVLAGGGLLLLVCLALIVVVLVRQRMGDVPLVWLWQGAGAFIAPGIVVAAAVVPVLLLAGGSLPFVWLFSGRSLGPLMLAPMNLLVVWMLAVRICLRPGPPFERAVVPLPAVLGGVLFALIVAVFAWTYLPVRPEAWRPPADVQVFRRVGTVAGLACILVLMTWTVWGWWRRRRAGLPAGAWARAGLAVASSSLGVLLLFAVIALGVDHRRDARHEAAFARAAADPIADRLGPQWWSAYFAPARALASAHSSSQP